MLYNSKLKLIGTKLRSKWEGPFKFVTIFPNGVVEIRIIEDDKTFKMNWTQLKIFQERQPKNENEMHLMLRKSKYSELATGLLVRIQPHHNLT